jgi:hypothetical protein
MILTGRAQNLWIIYTCVDNKNTKDNNNEEAIEVYFTISRLAYTVFSYIILKYSNISPMNRPGDWRL